MTIAELENEIDLLSLIERKQKATPIGENLYRVNPCPKCQSKDHFTIYTDTNSYNSFNGCVQGGSVYKYLMEVEEMNEKEAYEKLLELAGEERSPIAKNRKSSITSKPTKAEVVEQPTNYTERLFELYNNQTKKDREYFINRGFTEATIEEKKLVVGNTKQLGDSFGERRAIIPYFEDGEVIYYNARALDNTNTRTYKKPKGKSQIYGINNLKSNADYIFLVEGEFNAISLEQLGYKAIASGGANNTNIVIEAIEETNSTGKVFILALDNDKAGKQGSDKLKRAFEEKSISYVSMELERAGKDINDLLVEDMEHIRAIASMVVKKAENKKMKALRPHNTLDYLNNILADEIEELSKHKGKKTGFKNIDENTLFLPQLYVIGGLSSLGKTTFVHQMSDQLAEQGEHILFFSLEMSRLELVSKSLARLTILEDKTKASNSADIRLKNVKEENVATLGKALNKYCEFAERISIIEGNFNTSVFTIRDYVKDYIDRNEAKPVVIIDYLQILQSVEGESDKQKIDTTVTELKRMSRDFNIGVIVVSSLNRSNYLTPIDFESFNGSGGIEYTADVVWGLQLQCIHEEIFNKTNNIKEKRERINQCKSASIREVEVVGLKNRSGRSGYSAYFNYDCRYDLFMEDSPENVFHNNDKTERVRL